VTYGCNSCLAADSPEQQARPKNQIEGPTMAARILLIDDDQSSVQCILPVLARLGFQVDCTMPDLDAIRKMLIDEPDLVVLGVDSSEGWQFCHQLLVFLKGSSLFLLLRTDNEEDRVKGLRLGADDCMVKPVSMSEFVARVQAHLRRRSPETFQQRRSFFIDENMVVDLTRRDVRLNGEPVILSAMEFRLLACLVQHVGEVVSHKQLMTRMWGPDHCNSPSVLKSYIYKLRSKLEPDPRQPRRIVTRRRQGYMLQRIEG
jgi:two-component system response regulator VicR